VAVRLGGQDLIVSALLSFPPKFPKKSFFGIWVRAKRLQSLTINGWDGVKVDLHAEGIVLLGVKIFKLPKKAETKLFTERNGLHGPVPIPTLWPIVKLGDRWGRGGGGGGPSF